MQNEIFNSDRMMKIARKHAAKLGIHPNKIYRIDDLGENITGTTIGGLFIKLSPLAFKRAYDRRLGREVSPRENLKRTLLHENRHLWQAENIPDKYWNPKYRDELEADAYTYEDTEYKKH